MRNRAWHPLAASAWIMALLVVVPRTTGAENGLAAHWPLDEGTGTVARDVSGNSHHSRILGAQWARLGESSVLAFDGLNDVVNCGTAKSLDLRGPLTMSVWCQPSADATVDVGICGKGIGCYQITLYRLNSCYFYVGSGGNNTGLRGCVVPGVWQHVASTFDGTTIRLYMNGSTSGRVISALSECNERSQLSADE